MLNLNIKPTNQEVTFDEHEVIVSRTDISGKILYANKLFIDISGYKEEELILKPHSIIRHPDMPGAVFKLAWETIKSGSEIFAYVKNMCKSGAFYWVMAHMTPTYSTDGKLIGYHSNRRKPTKEAVDFISELYKKMLQIESDAPNRQDGILNSYNYLMDICKTKGESYDKMVLSI